MGRKALAVVPVLGNESRLERFHADATDNALYTVVTWSVAARKRQLAIAGNKLLELQRFQAPDDARSWFIGNDVQSDGSVLVFTPLDPLFVLLASSWHQRSRSMALGDLLAQDHNSWLAQVAACTPAKVRVICDVQSVLSGDDERLESLSVMANEAKIVQWLSAKVQRVATTLAQQANAARAQSHSGSFDTKFVLPSQSTSANASAALPQALDASAFTRDAVELVADYVPDDVATLLYKALKLEKQVVVVKAAVVSAHPHEAFQRFDRRRQDNIDSNNNSSNNSKRVPSPAAAALAKKKSKLANVDRTGMKSLTSFFGKK